jgi:hypothetical protein
MKMIMVSALSFLINACMGQNPDASQLIGEWKFIELQDEQGRVRKEIPIKKFGAGAMEAVNRDSYIFNADSTYIASNPYNTSFGKWHFDSTTHEINLELMVDETNIAFEALLARNMLRLGSDGKYYQKPVKKRIVKFAPTEMVLADRENYVLIYRCGSKG